MRWLLVLGMLAAPAAAVAQERQQFDLVCTSGKDTMRFRVDLGREEWCAADCRSVQKIKSVTTGTLTLQEEGPLPNGDTIVNRVSRSTGDWFYQRDLRSLKFGRTMSGVCDAAAFTGFPPPKF